MKKTETTTAPAFSNGKDTKKNTDISIFTFVFIMIVLIGIEILLLS